MAVLVENVETASEEELAQALGPEVECPLCGHVLRRDTLWTRPYFVDDRNHGYSNVRVLIQELREQGRYPEPTPNRLLQLVNGRTIAS
jgi:hypothetical protein